MRLSVCRPALFRKRTTFHIAASKLLETGFTVLFVWLFAVQLAALAGGASDDDCASRDGVIAWYRAENNADDSAGANQGTLQSGTTFAPGKVGQAFRFDGVDDHVSLGNPASLKFTGSITVGAWINPREVHASGLKAILTK